MYDDVDFNEWDLKKDNFKVHKMCKSELIYGRLSEKIPFISIMIPTYRRPEMLRKAIDSALSQTYKEEFEIVVIDNDYEVDENTDKLMKQYCGQYKNLYYYRNNRNIGMYGNWNRCIELCRTQWYCMLHDDDMLKPQYLENIVNFIHTQPDASIISVYRENLDERENEVNGESEKYGKLGKNLITSAILEKLIKMRKGRPIKIGIRECLDYFMPLMLCAAVNRNDAYEAGGYDEQYFPISDLFFVLKMAEHYKVNLVPVPLWYYRYSQNESMKKETLRGCLWLTKNLFETAGVKDKRMSERKAKIKAAKAVLYTWGGNSKLVEKADFEEEVIKICHLNRVYSSKLIRKYVFFERHLKRIALFCQK